MESKEIIWNISRNLSWHIFFYRDHLWTKAKKPKDLLDNNTDGAETIEDGLEDVESEITRYKSAKKVPLIREKEDFWSETH